jgi:phosphatidylinositol 4-kinase B
MTKAEIADSKVVVAAQFFENVWGKSAFVTRVVPLFIGLSALGNVFAQSFAMPRVKQELAKEGVLPLSRFWASDWPFNAPSGAIFLHWIFTSALILGSQTPDVYVFVTNVFIYSGNWIKGRSSYPTQLVVVMLTPSQSSSPSAWFTSTLRRRNGGPSSAQRSAARRC